MPALVYHTELDTSKTFNRFSQTTYFSQNLLWEIRTFKSFFLPNLMPPFSPKLAPTQQSNIYGILSEVVYLFFVFFDRWQIFTKKIYLGSHQAVIKPISWPTKHWKLKKMLGELLSVRLQKVHITEGFSSSTKKWAGLGGTNFH